MTIINNKKYFFFLQVIVYFLVFCFIPKKLIKIITLVLIDIFFFKNFLFIVKSLFVE